MKRCLHCHTQFDAANWTCPACAAGPEHTDGFPLLAPELANGGGGFQPEFFEQLAALEAKNFWFRARNQLIVWSMQKHFPDLRRYLEIGCGTGFVLAGVAQTFPAASLVGSELFQVGLPFAASRVRQAELIQMDARCIPYADEFDLIGAFDVLEHIEEDVAVLDTMHQALRPGGGIIVTVPQHPWLWSVADDHACHVRRYTADNLRNKVIGAGFNVEFETSFVSLLLPAMLASRLGRRQHQVQEDPLSELRLAGWLNSTFEAVMSLERRAIQHGLRFPWGGSRLLIATKA